MTATDPLIRAEGLSLSLPAPTGAVLSDIDLTVEASEVVSLLGPSGCGKSTLLRLLAGLAHADTGTIARASTCQGRGALGMVFQQPTLMPWANVAANVALPLTLIGGVPEADRARRVAEVLDLVGLGTSAGKYPHELSGGMQMRAALARALVSTPRLLLMDEPFAALDEVTRHRLNEDLLRLRDALGFGVVFVTHSSAEAAFLSDRILLLSPQPARIVEDITVTLPRPRTADLRASTAFQDLAARISARAREVAA